jgi:hypothetical protein
MMAAVRRLSLVDEYSFARLLGLVRRSQRQHAFECISLRCSSRAAICGVRSTSAVCSVCGLGT